MNHRGTSSFLHRVGMSWASFSSSRSLKQRSKKSRSFGLAQDFQGVELALAEGVQNALGMVFDEGQVHQGGGGLVLGLGHRTVWVWASWLARAKRAAVCLPKRARARW